MASISTGRLCETQISRASFVTLCTANTSLPSTLIVSIPYPLPREATNKTTNKSDTFHIMYMLVKLIYEYSSFCTTCTKILHSCQKMLWSVIELTISTAGILQNIYLQYKQLLQEFLPIPSPLYWSDVGVEIAYPLFLLQIQPNSYISITNQLQNVIKSIHAYMYT